MMAENNQEANQEESDNTPRAAERMNQKEIRRLTKTSRALTKGILRTVAAFLLENPVALTIATIVVGGLVIGGIILAVTIGIGVSTDAPSSGTSSHQSLSQPDLIKEVLAKSGDDEALRQQLIGEQAELNSQLDEIENHLASLPDAKQNAAISTLTNLIHQTRTLVNEFINQPNHKIAQQIKANLLIIQEKSAFLLIPSGADFSHLRDAPIAKILVIKSVQDASKRRIYFLDQNGQTLGSAPIEIGLNKRKTSHFDRGDKATPTGNYKIIGKRGGNGDPVYSRTTRNKQNAPIHLGFYTLDTDIKDARGELRGILIHGGAPERQDRLYPTAGCIRMYNRHLAYIFPLIKIGTPIEIRN